MVCGSSTSNSPKKYIKYTVSEDERAALFETAGRVRARESIGRLAHYKCMCNLE